MKSLFVLALFLSLASVAPVGEAEVCVDGCSNIALSLGDFVTLGLPNSGSCTACESGTVFSYKMYKKETCGEGDGPEGTFCTTSGTAGSKNYEVNAIGAGCSGSPQGCVRLCECP
jgi:hypothetical protein